MADCGAAEVVCRAVVQHALGAPKASMVVDAARAVPPPAAGQVRVRVEYCGLNPADYKVARGVDRGGFPRVLGQDACGVVEAVGADVSVERAEGGAGAGGGSGGAAVAVGDRVHFHGVFGFGHGTFAQYALTTADTVVRVPEGLSAADAAALPCAAWTAYQAVHRKLHVGGGGVFVVAGASGGVGSAAVQLGKLAGARVLAVCSGRNAAYVRELGADEVVDYTAVPGGDVAAAVRDATGGVGADWWLDCVGSDSAGVGIKALAFGGSLCSIAGTIPLTDGDSPFTRSLCLSYCFFGGGHEAHPRQRADIAAIGREVAALAAAGKLRANVSRTVALEDIPAALEDIEGGHVRGKIVAKVTADG